MKKCLMFIIAMVMLVSCGGIGNDATSKHLPKVSAKRLLCVYRYAGFPEQKAKMICNELSRYIPNVELVDTILSLPPEAYLKTRNRYRGTGLLDDLKKLQDGNCVLGLTDRIIFTSNEISKDFGIMGISYVNSGLCVASSVVPRSGKPQKDSDMIKLTLHELGHAYGLHHCPDQKCFMVDAEHKMKLPNTTGFCKKCTEYLQSAGVNL